MKISVLASGSKGNLTYVETPTTKLLIDIGISTLQVEKKLNELNVKASEINGIILTHTHKDHISGLPVFTKKYSPNVYLTKTMFDSLDCTNENYCIVKDQIHINDLAIDIISTSHDADDSCGFILNYQDSSVVYITDTGYINNKYHDQLTNKTMYIIESNHCPKLLMDGPYPFYLKQRVIGDSGHLSNEQCAMYLQKFIGEKTQNIILAHLSAENNEELLALNKTREKLLLSEFDVPNLIAARQNERTDLIEL